MSKEKAALPKGTRDFGPEQMILRNHIIGTIRSVFERFGFMPLETPAMEKLSVLTGKYGDEGDQLLFKILNSGDFLSGAGADEREDSKKLLWKISEKGLRYDLTVPFARFVVMNQHNIAFPFRRYQVQPVWRADRPQKGRYREFYQCDADVVGTRSLICEAEIIQMIGQVFERLKIVDYDIRINHRKILEGIAQAIGEEDRFQEMCVGIDKLDKIGMEKVRMELESRGFKKESLETLEQFLSIGGDNASRLDTLDKQGSNSLINEGIEDTRKILEYVSADSELLSRVSYDVQLARGLSYYTGTIFEVMVNNVRIGSVGGGGRYDDLTGVFGLNDIPGVGFSFGVDRLYDVITELDLFETGSGNLTRALIINFDAESETYGMKLLSRLRSEDINAEIFPDPVKLKKQMNYADRKGIPFVILAGEEEIRTGKVTLKNMSSGEQIKLDTHELIPILKH
jgi:histidyl-tRNA synthetase